MENNRNRFFEYFLTEGKELNYACLNYSGCNLTDFTENDLLEILISPKDMKLLISKIHLYNDISVLKARKKFDGRLLIIGFNDGTSLTMDIKTCLYFRGVIFMKATEVLKTAVTNVHNIKVPVPSYYFEYIMLNHLLRKKDVEPKYREYFSLFAFQERSQIFAYIVPKYNYVINLLDDLFIFKKYNLRKARNKISASHNLLAIMFNVSVHFLSKGRWKYFGRQEEPSAKKIFAPAYRVLQNFF